MSVSLVEVALMLCAGTAAGIAGTVAGLASIVSYPALLATGMTPLAANVTNTVALVLSGVGATAASKEELAGQRGRLKSLLVAGICGGTTGAVLLLVTPPGAFALIVPWLVGGSSVLLMLQPRLAPRPSTTRPLAPRPSAPRPSAAAPSPAVAGPRRAWLLAVFAISVYGGYFGAAAGVLMLALLAATLTEGLHRVNALKNVTLAAANGVAALGFAVFGPVDWPVAVPLALGCLLGGWSGPRLARRIPPGLLRIGIAVAGLALAVHLWTTAQQ